MSYILLFVLLIVSYFIGSIQGSYISSAYIYKDDRVLSDWQEYKTVHTFSGAFVEIHGTFYGIRLSFCISTRRRNGHAGASFPLL